MRQLARSFCALILSLSSLQLANAAEIDIAKYVNWQVGNRWTYQQSISTGLWSVQVDSFAVRNGSNVILLQEYDSSGFKNDQDFYASDFSQGLMQVGGLNDFGQPTEEISYYSPPALFMAASFEPNRTYTSVVSRSNYPGLAFQHSVSFSFDTVTVPLGTFVDTLRVSVTFSNAAVGTLTETRWYACGLGLVRRVQDDGNVWQLSAYSGSRSDCSARAYKLVFAAFIPGNSFATGRPCLARAGRNPQLRDLYVRTDDRLFDPLGKTYRVRQRVTVVPSDLSRPRGIVEDNAPPDAHPTRFYASDALRTSAAPGAPPGIGDEDDDGVGGDCSLFHEEVEPLLRGMRVSSERTSPQQVRVRLQGSAGTRGLPFGLGRRCDITWDLTVQIDESTSPPTAFIEGSHDGFPAYEVYLDGRALHKHWPGDPPYDYGDLFKLCQPMQPITPHTILLQ